MEYQGLLLENLDAHQLELTICDGLLRITQQFLHQPEKAVAPVCAAVTSLTCGLFQLALHGGECLKEGSTFFPANAISFPVRLYEHCYGTLYCLSSDLAATDIPLHTGTNIAASCAICLYFLESAAFTQQWVERLDYRIPEKLTKQQREILALICQGCSDEDIARELSIAAPTANKRRQRIYQLFSTHSGDDVAFIAFHHRLFSPIGLNLTDQIEREQQREGSRLMFPSRCCSRSI